MGTTVKHAALMNAIGRELNKAIELKRADSAARLAKSSGTEVLCVDITMQVSAYNTTDELKTELANAIYGHRLAIKAVADAAIAENDAAIVELESQLQAVAQIDPATFQVDADGNVDFDVAQKAIADGLERDEATVMAAAQKGMSDAAQRVITLRALRDMTAAFTPEMI